MKNFWKRLKKPIIVMAPMADVTDIAFRRMFAKYGKPDVIWTEFVSADGLILAPDKPKKSKKNKREEISPKDILLKDLEYTEKERPIVAQLFSSSPENMEKASRLVQNLGFDGVDINMGCPDKSIEKQKAGAIMMKNPENAKEIIEAVKRGAPKIPVSVKTRIGYKGYYLSHSGQEVPEQIKKEFEEWISFLLKQDLACLIIHFRTRKELSKVPAHWELAKRAVELKDKISPETILLGNGDVKDLEDAYKKIEESGLDGVMVGRGVFGNPWFFAPLSSRRKRESTISTEDRINAMLEHTKLFEELLPHKNFSVMKKHYKAYIEGFVGAKELRIALMKTKDGLEVEKIVKKFLNKK